MNGELTGGDAQIIKPRTKRVTRRNFLKLAGAAAVTAVGQRWFSDEYQRKVEAARTSEQNVVMFDYSPNIFSPELVAEEHISREDLIKQLAGDAYLPVLERSAKFLSSTSPLDFSRNNPRLAAALGFVEQRIKDHGVGVAKAINSIASKQFGIPGLSLPPFLIPLENKFQPPIKIDQKSKSAKYFTQVGDEVFEVGLDLEKIKQALKGTACRIVNISSPLIPTYIGYRLNEGNNPIQYYYDNSFIRPQRFIDIDHIVGSMRNIALLGQEFPDRLFLLAAGNEDENIYVVKKLWEMRGELSFPENIKFIGQWDGESSQPAYGVVG